MIGVDDLMMEGLLIEDLEGKLACSLFFTTWVLACRLEQLVVYIWPLLKELCLSREKLFSLLSLYNQFLPCLSWISAITDLGDLQTSVHINNFAINLYTFIGRTLHYQWFLLRLSKAASCTATTRGLLPLSTQRHHPKNHQSTSFSGSVGLVMAYTPYHTQLALPRNCPRVGVLHKS